MYISRALYPKVSNLDLFPNGDSRRPSFQLLREIGRFWHCYQELYRTVHMNQTNDELVSSLSKLNNALVRVRRYSLLEYQKLVSKISSIQTNELKLNFTNKPYVRFKPIYGEPQMRFNPYNNLVIPSIRRLETIQAKLSGATIKEIIEAHYIFYTLHCYLKGAGSDIYLEEEEVSLRNGGLVNLFNSFRSTFHILNILPTDKVKAYVEELKNENRNRV